MDWGVDFYFCVWSVTKWKRSSFSFCRVVQMVGKVWFLQAIQWAAYVIQLCQIDLGVHCWGVLPVVLSCGEASCRPAWSLSVWLNSREVKPVLSLRLEEGSAWSWWFVKHKSWAASKCSYFDAALDVLRAFVYRIEKPWTSEQTVQSFEEGKRSCCVPGSLFG